MGRTQTSATILHSIFREKTIGISEDREIDWGKKILQKRYLALVFGVPKQSKGLISVPLAKILGHQDEVWYLQFSHNGKYLASADQLLYGRIKFRTMGNL
ncbi:RNA pseudouridine synthase 4, mitochondrial [Beta vulgaris subsp. vulgaris]|uniref:RNA pseudouridine synthase 4, mitochondrial n=1 Tax=Beta vulgaris subsp. vulgaris TaxID=3555 RepID=UPI002547D781|nr:RNA pseudouridine synthase 4, mitochondrial [Beta vulgaris subsp. vulgaris]